MDELKDKVEGGIKEKLGGLTGDESTELEGTAQKEKGNLEEGARKSGEEIEEAAEKFPGSSQREPENKP